MENKVVVTFRTSPKNKEWLEEMKWKHRTDVATVIRAMLSVAKAHESEVVLKLSDLKELG